MWFVKNYVFINKFMRRKLLLSVKYRINSNNNDKHIWQCDVTGPDLTKERDGFSFVLIDTNDITMIDALIIKIFTLFNTYWHFLYVNVLINTSSFFL